MPKPKVLFLSKYPVAGASSRYRVYQYLPHFQRLDARVQSLMGNTSYDLIYQDGKSRKRTLYGLLDYFRRAYFILTNLNAEAVYMQREIFAFGPLWAEKLLKKLGIKLIFDLDDALFINKVNRTNPYRWDKAARVREIIRTADLVVAGNQWIRDQSLEIGASAAVHIDVAEKLQPREGGQTEPYPLHALWLGSATTSKYLKLIEQALVEIQRSTGMKLTIVGGDPTHEFSFAADFVPWSPENERHYLSECNVGLMPLPEEPWSKGKCGGKARTYMAAGLVPVVSAIGYNLYLIGDKSRGFLCKTEQDWVESIQQLHDDPSLLERIREENYKYVARHFDQAGIAAELEEAILKTIAG